MVPLTETPFQKAAAELWETWQARALKAATEKRAAVLLSVLSHNFDDQMLVLLHLVYPGFTSIKAPFLCSAGKVGKRGEIVADMVGRYGTITKDVVMYCSEIELRDDFRRLADELKFSDEDRRGLFAAVKRWVVADRRLDPTMDPQDPDAKRLVH